MESTLKRLFEYQKFEGNAELQSVIDSVHSRYAVRELSLEDMSFASAAGIPELPRKDRDGRKTRK